jgi:hypothetical protein
MEAVTILLANQGKSQIVRGQAVAEPALVTKIREHGFVNVLVQYLLKQGTELPLTKHAKMRVMEEDMTIKHVVVLKVTQLVQMAMATLFNVATLTVTHAVISMMTTEHANAQMLVIRPISVQMLLVL